MENQKTFSLGSYQAYYKRFGFQLPILQSNVSQYLGISLVIPIFAEPNLMRSIKSLANCEKPNCEVELILVFNASSNSTPEEQKLNLEAKRKVEDWYNQQDLDALPFKLLIIEENQLNEKHAGVGLARKIGMDEALYRFHLAGNLNGIIACFDADSICEPNYLIALRQHFFHNSKSDACSIYFEHPITGNEFDEEIYNGISNYELHLRYYVNGLAYAGLPYAIHTIGSSMAVRAEAYEKEGGMNKRKAGEDFYFLQKFISKGTCTVHNSTCIIPSPRMSNRVPFGTGRAIKEMLEKGRKLDISYDFKVFQVLRQVREAIEKDQWLNNAYLIGFYGKETLKQKRDEISANSSSREQFIKRIYHWFNGFQCLKFIHFLRDEFFPNQDLGEQALLLLKVFKPNTPELQLTDLLEEYRMLDKERN